MYQQRNLFVEHDQFPMGYPHSPGANIMRVERNSLAGCRSCGEAARSPSVLGRVLSLRGLGGLGSVIRATQVVGTRGLGGLGQAEGEGDGTLSPQARGAAGVVFSLLGLAGTALGAYHGYRRNRGSIGWAIGWGLLGGMFPVITVPVALAQGYGKPAGGR